MKCFFGFHWWRETSRWDGAWWDTVKYICLRCGITKERWERYTPFEYSLDYEVKIEQKITQIEKLARERERYLDLRTNKEIAENDAPKISR